MPTKTTKRSNSSRKSTTKMKNRLPANISYNTGGSYRVRKQVNGQLFDRTFASLKDAKAILSAL